MAKKRKATIVAVVLVLVILTASFVIYQLGLKSSNVPSVPFTGALWKHPIEHFATAITVDDGKVFIVDEPSNVYCFDSQNGESTWNTSISGRARNPSLVISDGLVYFSYEERKVSCLDENSGELLWTFENGLAPEEPFKGVSPDIVIEGGRLFAISGKISTLDPNTGKPLSRDLISRIRNSGASPNGPLQISLLRGDTFDGDFVYATGGNYSDLYFFKIDIVNTKTIWRSTATWEANFAWSFVPSIPLPSVVAVSQEKVIIRVFLNETSSVNLFLCLDTKTGGELWRFDVGAGIYNPVVKDDLLLFGAADGYFYAVNLADGTIAWKTKIDNQNLFSSGVHSSSPIQIDSKNQELFWSYAVEQNETSNYTGALISLDLAKGNVMWMTQTNSSCGSLAFNNSTDRLFLTTSAADVGLWIFDAATGDLIHNQQFDHRVLPPVVLGKETFVTGDLWLYSYQ
jgi:outer membrane protein assembly factor BamB